MAKITRQTQKIFGSTAGTNQISQYGSLKAGTPTFTTSISTIQALVNYTDGWFDAVIGGNSPAIEDMNALHYLYAYQLAYIMQAGIPEWDSGTTYYIGSLANDGTGLIYKSLQDNNLNNAISNTAFWQLKDFPTHPGASGYVLSTNSATGIAWTETPLFQDFGNNRVGINTLVPLVSLQVESSNNGAITSLNASTLAMLRSDATSQSAYLTILSNNTAGQSGIFLSRTNSAQAGALIYQNVSDTLVFQSAAANGGSMNGVQAWSFGPVGGLTSGNKYHVALGSLVSSVAGNLLVGTFGGGATEADFGANIYRDTASIKALVTQTGYVNVILTPGTTNTATAYKVLANYQDAQTAGSTLVTTNEKTILLATTVGAFTFGSTAMPSTAYHKFFGSVLSDTNSGSQGSGGFYGGTVTLEVGSNAYRDASGGIHNLGGSGGLTLLQFSSVSNNTNTVLQFVSGTTGTTTSNLFKVRGDGLFNIQSGGLLLPNGADTLDYYDVSTTRIPASSLQTPAGVALATASVAGGYVNRIGKIVHVQLQCDFKVAVNNDFLNVLLPFTAVSTTRQIFQIPCLASPSNIAGTGQLDFDTTNSATYVRVYSTIGGVSTFSSTVNNTIGTNFWYECT